jgi:GntR family transcriptional regulator/MocR family aminotransferase
LYGQVCDAIRLAILDGRLSPGDRLPGSRSMAEELVVSRNTVNRAIDQLELEGYLEKRAASGVIIKPVLPDELLQAIATHELSPTLATDRRDSDDVAEYPPPVPLQPGIPSVADFPRQEWARIHRLAFGELSDRHLSYGDPLGYRPLREMLAERVVRTRGIDARPDQILVVSGAQNGIYLALSALDPDRRRIGVESPGYPAIRTAAQALGATVIEVPVDREGMLVPAARRASIAATVVTPSHQYPTGVTMSVARRLHLLEWAAKNSDYIIEDDYESEYRYEGRPAPALKSLDMQSRVIYIGTFSKTLAPALRLGYVVAEADLLRRMWQRRQAIDRQPPTVCQATLCRFIECGAYGRHVRRTRRLYKRRRDHLIRGITSRFGEATDIMSDAAGLHLTLRFRDRIDDVAMAENAAQQGVRCVPLSTLGTNGGALRGLLLGFAGYPRKEIDAALDVLVQSRTGSSRGPRRRRRFRL